MATHKVNTRYITKNNNIVRKNDVYVIEDNDFLNNLTLSKTTLRQERYTSGHKHDGLDEAYYFISGDGIMRINDDYTIIEPGDIVLVPGGDFHQVINTSKTKELIFICVFQKYDREDLSATTYTDK